MMAARPFVPFPPLEGPMALEIVFRFRRPKSHYRSNGSLKPDAPMWKSGRQDIDNTTKAVMDCLTDIGMWIDDGQVVVLHVKRIYHSQPGAMITIQPPVQEAAPLPAAPASDCLLPIP